MGRNRAFEDRAGRELERIKALEDAEEEREQARMRELSERARRQRAAEAAEERKRKEVRHAKLRHSQEEKAKAAERRAKQTARRSWNASCGEDSAFEQAWPSM